MNRRLFVLKEIEVACWALAAFNKCETPRFLSKLPIQIDHMWHRMWEEPIGLTWLTLQLLQLDTFEGLFLPEPESAPVCYVWGYFSHVLRV